MVFEREERTTDCAVSIEEGKVVQVKGVYAWVRRTRKHEVVSN